MSHLQPASWLVLWVGIPQGTVWPRVVRGWQHSSHGSRAGTWQGTEQHSSSFLKNRTTSLDRHRITQNHRITKAGKELRDYPVQPSTSHQYPPSKPCPLVQHVNTGYYYMTHTGGSFAPRRHSAGDVGLFTGAAFCLLPGVGQMKIKAGTAKGTVV